MQPVLPDLGIFGIDFNTLEKRIHRNAQSRHMAHGASEIFLFQRRQIRIDLFFGVVNAC